MPDRINKKVVKLFAKHKKNQNCCSDEENVIRNEDGYYYVCIKKDDNGHHFDEKRLLERTEDFYYIVNVMVNNSEYPHIYSYKVPGEKILDFIEPYVNNDKEGRIIEIDKHYPGDLA